MSNEMSADVAAGNVAGNLDSSPGGMDGYFDAVPVYWVLFRCDTEHDSKYAPILAFRKGEALPGIALTDGILGLSCDFASALPAVWYAMHLPRNVLDTVELLPRFLRAPPTGIDHSHHVFLLPHNAPTGLFEKVPRPSLILGCGGVEDEATRLGAAFDCSVLMPEDATPESLARTWNDIGRQFGRDGMTRRLSPPKWVEVGADAGMILTSELLLRQLGSPDFIESLGHAGELSLHARVWAAVLGEADHKQENPDVVSDEFTVRVEEQLRRLRLPVTVAVPGMAPRHARLIGASGRRISPAEERALDILVTHHALAADGVAFRAGEVPAVAFEALHRLENAMTASRISGKRVQHLLKTLGAQLIALLRKEEQAVVSRASRLTFFSPLPMGLAILPGHSAPLSCRGPVAYVPLMPLNRCIQLETIPKPPITLERLRVLIVDGIGNDDDQGYVRAMVEPAWEVVQEAVGSISGWECSIAQAGGQGALVEHVKEHQPNILWINAHGSWLRDQNAAGILLEDEFTLLEQLFPAPPVVLLSSCETAPRAASPVSVVDVLLRSRARAVVGTMVPVNARHNAFLITRLFAELVDNVKSRRSKTFADVWSRVTALNAYHDITMASEQVLEWSLAGGDRRPEIQFKNERSNGRLRGSHIYEDSVAILTEIADETGFGNGFRATMANPGYVPETLFYGIFGWPETVRL